MLNKMIRTLKDKRGQGMVEYGLIIALIAVVVVVALTPAGAEIAKVFDNITASIKGTPVG